MPLTPIEVLNRIVEDRVAKTSLTTATTLQALYANGRLKTKTNTSIDWDAEVGGGAVAIEPVTQDGLETATDNVVPANLRIGRYRVKHQFSISRIAIAEAATRAPGELADLFNAQVDRGLTRIFREVNRLIYQGDGTAASGEFIGFNKIHDDTFAYAGISPVTYPVWKTLKLTGSPAGTARALTKNLLLDLEELLTMNESNYNLIVCSPNTGKKYNQLFDTVAGGVSTDASMQAKQVDLGHGRRTYNGAIILEDPQAPNGVMHFINTNDVDLFSFKIANNPTPMSQTEYQVASTNAYGLNVNIAELPSNNSAVRKFEIFTLPQLRVYNRKSLAAIQDIA